MYRREIIDNISILESTVLSSAQTVITETKGVEAINYYFSVTGAVSDVITVVVETSSDQSQWFPVTTLADSGGTTDIYNRTFQFTMTGASDLFQLPINLQDNYTRITVSSDNVSGTAAITATTIR